MTTPITVGVLRETAIGERRVALTPDGVTRLSKLGLHVVVETAAGAQAWFPDEAYVAAGARITDLHGVYSDGDVLVCIRAPAQRAGLRAGQVLIGLLQPLVDGDLVRDLSAASVTSISLDGIPRTLSSAQSMDALTSQANVAGYKAALVAADTYPGYFPMLMTAAGTVRPAKVLVIGAGVAGLQALGTARRLGAVVTGYDVRAAARDEVVSTGAAFLELGETVSPESPESEVAADGYARQLTGVEQAAQQEALIKAVATFDVVITTAQVPGRRPPVLLPAAAVAAMHPGSVVVDLAAGPLGGNVVGSLPDRTVVTTAGVTIIGAGNLPSSAPQAASVAYSRNIAALLAHLVVDGVLRLETSDEVTAGILITRAGAVVHPGVAARMAALEPPDITPELVATGQGPHR